MRNKLLLVPADIRVPVRTVRLPWSQVRAMRTVHRLVSEDALHRHQVHVPSQDGGYDLRLLAADYAFGSTQPGRSRNSRAQELTGASVYGDAVLAAMWRHPWEGWQLAGISADTRRVLLSRMGER